MVLSWSGFRHTDRFRRNGPKLCIFLFSKVGKLKPSMLRVPYNKLLTKLASSSRTGEYWPSVVFVRTSLRSVRTATTLGQYSPVRPSRSVSKRLLFFCILFVFRFLQFLKAHTLRYKFYMHNVIYMTLLYCTKKIHDTTLHYTRLHYTTLDYTTLHYTTLH